MKTGINMTSVNKIKELAEAKEYWEALDLVEEQDLDKSYNPQFLRLCGEIYIENGRYEESRKVLLKAHAMSPEGNRIIYSIIRLYLHMGYFTRAEKYFEQYRFNEEYDKRGRIHLEYMLRKARHADPKELLALLLPICDEEEEDKWIFELALLYSIAGREDKAVEECRHVIDLFKGSRYAQLAQDLISGEFDVATSFYRYPLVEELEQNTDSEIAIMEEEQLARDYERMFPKDPVIVSMIDDVEESGFAFGKKINKKAKKQKNDAKKKDNDDSTKPEDMESAITEESIDTDEDSNEEAVIEEPKNKKFKLFGKKNKKDAEETLFTVEDIVKAKPAKHIDTEEEKAIEDMATVIEEEEKPITITDIVSEAKAEDSDILEDVHTVEVGQSDEQTDIRVEAEAIMPLETSTVEEDKDKLIRLVEVAKQDIDEGIPSYDEIKVDVSRPEDLREKYKSRELGQDGIDEDIVENMPEAASILKRLMENQENIARKLEEEKTAYEVPLTDEYIKNLEEELHGELESLNPPRFDFEEDSKNYDNSAIEELNANRDNTVLEDKVEAEAIEEDTSSKVEETQEDTSSIEEAIEDAVTSAAEDTQICYEEEMLESDDIDSVEIIDVSDNLWKNVEKLDTKIQEEAKLQEEAEKLLASLGIDNEKEQEIPVYVNHMDDELLRRYMPPYDRAASKAGLIVSVSMRDILTTLKERR